MGGRRRTLLLVESDALQGRALKRELRQRFEVDVASTVDEGKEALAALRPDVGLYAVTTTDQAGLELVEHGPQLSPSTIPLILVGGVSVPLAVTAMRQGAAAVLEKPIRAQDVGRAIEELRVSTTDLDRLRWVHVHRTVSAHDGNLTRAARLLGCSRQGLAKMISRAPPRGAPTQRPR